MAANSELVRAYAETYSLEEVTAFRAQALAAHAENLPRVEITGGGMKESSSQGVFIAGDPVELIEIFNAVIDRLNVSSDLATVANKQMNHVDFSSRQVRW